jgi:hypothetical protein
MQELANFVSAFAHHLEPFMRDSSQYSCVFFHPRIDGGVTLDSAVEA